MFGLFLGTGVLVGVGVARAMGASTGAGVTGGTSLRMLDDIGAYAEQKFSVG